MIINSKIQEVRNIKESLQVSMIILRSKIKVLNINRIRCMAITKVKRTKINKIKRLPLRIIRRDIKNF